MPVVWLIAFRYLRARRRLGAVNTLAWIAVTGIGLGSACLIVVLSVFNGFYGVIDGVFATFDPDLKVVAATGQPFTLSAPDSARVAALPGVAALAPTLEGRAVVRYYDRQAVVTAKGVPEAFYRVSRVTEAIVAGERPRSGKTEVLLGTGVAYRLQAHLGDAFEPLVLYSVSRSANLLAQPEGALRQQAAFPSGVFSLQKEYDDQLVVMGLGTVQSLLDLPGHITALELRLAPGARPADVQRALTAALGPQYRVLNRAEQHPTLYRILVNEKWIGFLLIGLILLVVSATIVGTLAMIVSHKAPEVGTLATLGATPGRLQQVFLALGLTIGGLAALGGLLLGGVLCGLQAAFGLVPIYGGESFLITSWPVRLVATDFIWVGLTVLGIALVAAYLPARAASRLSIPAALLG